MPAIQLSSSCLRARIVAGAMACAIFAAAATLLTGGAPSYPTPTTYSHAQALRGQLVYVQYCLKCHGAKLQGISGPPLTGPTFDRSLAVGRMKPGDLFHFISTSMPMYAPGSLSQDQYRDVQAFLYERNAHAVPQALPRATTTGSAVPLARTGAVTDERLRGSERQNDDWLLPGRTYANQRFSPLAQIDTTTVANLVPVNIVHTGMIAGFETTPIVVDGTMYLSTPVLDHRMKIMALEAATGKTIWTTTYALGAFKECCGPINRGVSVAYDSVFFVTLDDKLVSLDAHTGRERWEATVADRAVGYSESMAPQVYDGSVIIGSAGGEWAVRGFIAAYDARTGKQRWRWYTTDPKSFAGNSWKHGGGTIWTTPAIDAERGLVIFGVGNPNPDLDGSKRLGDNRYTDSIVALDARTGTLRWFYQEVKHDEWDYDAASNVVLFDLHSNGKTIPAAGQAGKVGWFFIVDRRNGRLIRKSEPFVALSPNMFKKKKVLPGANGGSEWSPPAYSPRLHRAYVLGINQLMDFDVSAPAGEHPGFMRTGSVFKNVQKPSSIQTGTFTAIDVETGKIAWQRQMAKPMIGGALATGGNLVFTGEGDGTFEAFDATSGKRVWQYDLVAGVNAPPISYAVGGKQYVAVAAGGNYQLNYKQGDLLAIFALKK